MANFFDQFDDKPAATGGNFFDQFDEPAEEGPVGPSGPQSRGLARARKLRSPSMATAVRDQIFGPGWGKTLTEDVPTTVRGGLAAMVAGTKLKALQELQEAKSATDPASLRRDSSLEEAVARERGVVREAMGDMRGAREGSNFMQGAVQTAAMSLAQSSGALGVGLLTRSPWLAAAAMYPSTEGLKYGQLDEMGMQDPAAKRKFAAVEGMLEVGTELAPFDALLKSGSDPLQRVAQFLIRELPGESIATLTQGANDHIAELYAQGKPVNALDVAEGLLKASKDLPETWVSTVLAGGLQSGAVSLAEMPARRQADRQYDLNLSRQSVDALNPANAQMEMRPVAPEGETLADAVTPEQVWDRNPPEQVVPDMQYTVENPLPEANFFDQFDEPTTVAAQPVAPEETSTTPPPAGDRTPQAAPTTSQPETKITFSTDKDINDAYEAAVEKSAEVPESLRVTPDRAGVRSFRETVYERRNMLDGFQRSLISRQGPPTDNRQWPKNPELKNILRGWGLPVGGNRDELITRIREAHLTAFGAYRNEDLNDLTLKVLKPMAESLGIKHQYMNKAQIVGELQFKLRGMRASVIEQANRESYQRDIQNYLRVRRGPLTKEEYTFLLNESGIPREQFDTQLKQKGLYPREMEAQRRELEEMQRRSKAAPIPPAGTTGQFGESTVEVLGPAEPDAQGHPQVRVKITSEFKRGSELTIRASTFLPKEKETPEPAPMVEHQQRRAANARMKLREILQDGVESVPTDPEAFAKWWAGDRFKSADGGVHTSQALLDFGSQFEQMVQSAYGAQFIIDGRKDAPNFYEAPVDYIEYWSKKIDAHVEAQTAETTDALEWALSESEVKSEFEDPDTAKMGLTVAEGGMHTLDAELRSGKIVYALKAQPHSTAVVDETKKRKKGEPPVYITFDSYDAAITELTKRAAAWNADPENARMDELVESETMDRDVRDVDARPIFPPPDKTTRAADALKGTEFLTQKEADALVEEWKAAAKAAGSQEDNSKKVVISLFDHSGVWSQPWVDAGYTVIRSDLKRGDDLMQSNPAAIAADLKASGMRVVGVLAAPPCTSFAGSGAGWWQQQHDVVSKDWVRKKYGDFAAEYFDRPLDYAVAMVRMAEQYVEQTDPVFYAFENPVGRVQRMADLPDPTLIFQPHHYGDPSTKRTMLWGEFNPDLPTANVRPKESKAHKLRGDDPKQKALRSLTPEGFAYAFFVANHGATAETQTADALAEEQKGADQGGELASRAPGGTMPEPMLAPAPVLPLPGTTPLQRIAGERAAGIEQKYQKLTLKYPALKPAGRDVPLGASNYDTLWTEMVRRRDGETDSEFEARQKAFAQRMRTAGAAAQWKAARSFVLTRFGFNDVVMDKEADVRESLDALLDAFNNLDTHAAVLGLPRAAVGLNRQLTLRLTKTLGNRYTLGMFSWGSMGGRDGIPVVSIARRNDSFTHEWAHAFDHWLMKLAGVESGALTTQIVGKSLGDVAALKEAMPEIHARFRELMQTIFYDLTNEQVTELEKYMAEIAQYKEDIAAESNADVVKKLREEIEAYNARIQQILDSSKTPFLQGSEMQDALAGVEYYSMPAEMLARAVQRYMSNMVNQWKGTEFITDPPPLYPERRTRQDTVMPERDMTENPGLSEHEARIAIAIRNLMGAVAGANVFRDTGPAAQRRDADALSANNLLTEVEVAARQIPELTFLQRVVARTREDIEGLTRATLAMRDKLKKLVSSPKASAVQLLEIANMLPKALGNGMLYSGRGMLLGLIGKYKGNAALQSELRLILNKVATDPGSGTYQGWQDERGNIQNDMDTAVERKTKARLNMEARIRKVHGIDDTDETQMQQLRDMLTRPTEALITSQRVALQNAEDRMADIVKSIAALTDQQRQVFEDIESALKDPRLDPNSKEENETWIREQKAYFAQRRAALQSARDQLAWDIKLGRERLELLQATDAVVDAKLDEVDVAIRMLESSNTLEEGIQRLRALADRAYDATTGAGKGRRKALREYADLAAKMGAAAQSAGVTDAAEIINVALDTLKAQQSRLNIEVERRKGLADLKKIPENVKKAAVAYRAMLDKLRYEGIDAGISLGYVPNGYLPRKYDEVKIDDNQEKFLDQAAKTYRDGILQEREFLITYISDLIAQQERLAGEKQERVAYGDRSFNRDAQLRDLAQRINKMKARLKELESESPKELAESFLLKALHNDFGDFGGLTPPRDFTRRRKLPPSADTFLAEFMETNPVHLIQQYIQRATRRQEYARRFGQDGEILEMHRLKLLAAGMERGDFSIVDRALQIATGSFRPYAGQGNTALGLTNRFVDYIYHRAMMVLLVRASFPSLTEGAIVGMRTKSMKDSAKGLAEHYRLLFGQHPDQRDLYELARLEGIIGDALTEQAVHNRMLLMEGDKTFDRSQLATYFTATMLHRITVSNRVMSMRLMQFHVETWVDRYLAPQSAEEKAAAESEMNEWGIPPEKRQEFAQWVKDHGGVVDADSMLEDVEDSWQQVYADVLYRLVDQTQMNPKSMDRPVGAFNPVGRFVLSITGFNWTFQRNVLIRTGKDIMRHQGDSAKQTALMRTLVAAQYVGPAMLLILMGQILQSMRDWYDDPTGEKFERRIENAEDHPFLAMLNAISRAGGFGGWDPVYQLVPQLAYPEGYKWRRRLGDTFVGAIPGWFLTQLNDIWDGLTDIVTDQTPNSNFAERRMWKAIYNLTFAWTIVGVVARHRIPGFLGFLLATQSTSAAARNTFAEFMAPKTEQELKREKQRQARRSKSESGSKVL